MSFHSLLYLPAGLVIMAVGLPLLKGQIPPNAVYGMRLPASFESRKSWDAINKYGGRQFVRGGAVTVIASLLGMLLPFEAHVVHPIFLAAFLLATLIPTWMTIRFARAWRRRE